MTACRKCRNPIRFVQNTESGRRIPVDAVPDDDGNVLAYSHAIRTTKGEVVSVELIGHPRKKGEPVPAGWALFMPHYATCRARLRRGRGRGTPQPQITFDTQETETR